MVFPLRQAVATGLTVAVFLASLSGAGRAENDFRALAEVLFDGNPHPEAEQVKRWTGRVGWLTTEKDPAVIGEIERAVAEINGMLAGSGVSLYKTDKDAGLIISFLAAEKIASLPGSRSRSDTDNVGLSVVFSKPTNEIFFASVAISKDLTTEHLRYVLRHELMHAVGIPKHTTYVPDSVLRQTHKPRGMTQRFAPFDLEAIRFLYKHLPPGATPDQARSTWMQLNP